MDKDIVIAIGEVVVDWISTSSGRDFDAAQHFERSIGGNALNVAVAVARLGTKSRLIGKCGDDLHGKYLRAKLRAENVDLEYLFYDINHPTAQCYAVRDEHDEAVYFNWPRPNAADMLALDDITYDAMRQAAIIHATGISLVADPRRTAVLYALETAKSQGLLVSFDAGFPTDSSPESVRQAKNAMALADMIKVNIWELLFWTGEDYQPNSSLCKSILEKLEKSRFNYESEELDDLRVIVERFCHEHQPVVLLLTLGHLGSFVIRESEAIFCAPQTVQSVSSIGAGDGYVAGMLHALVEERISSVKQLNQLTVSKWKEIGSFANAVGAMVTQAVSAIETLPTACEVTEFLKTV